MGVGESGRQHLLLILQRVIYIIHNEVGHTKSHITNIDKKKVKILKIQKRDEFGIRSIAMEKNIKHLA